MKTFCEVDEATKQLDLLPAQQKRVQPILARYEDARSDPPPADAWLGAFEADALDVKELLRGSPAAARAELERQVSMLTELLPVLKPEQREKLALAMEQSRQPVARPGGLLLRLPLDEPRPFPRRP